MAGDESEVAQPVDSIEWHELLIFQLSPRLGGRTEVMETPLVEALKHYVMEKQKEQGDRYLSFLSMFYANPMVKADERKKFMETIKPKTKRTSVAYETDIEQLKRLKAMQEGGGL